ncbi:MAG: DUF3298 and DUF4163 domain-containing protein [Saprospiraceae bacterium]|nr:DUF3298 and DUF4163 domain-containing protein [Saprospiraceae bacterium]
MGSSIFPAISKTLNFFLALIGLMVLVTNCGERSTPADTNPERQDPEESSRLTFKLDTLAQQSPNCETDSSNCAKVNLVFPYAERGPTAMCVAFNRLQLKYLRGSLADVNGEEEKGTVKEIMNQFLEDYKELQGEDLPFSMPWSLETEGQVLYQNDKLVSVQLYQYSYTGGAHPNTFSTIWMFDKASSEPLQWEDLGVRTDTLEVIAEQAFRKAAEIPVGKSLEEAGFFEGEEFALPKNYGLVKDGLLLYYNTYEIAPYVFGPTEVIIPWADLKVVFETDQWL